MPKHTHTKEQRKEEDFFDVARVEKKQQQSTTQFSHPAEERERDHQSQESENGDQPCSPEIFVFFFCFFRLKPLRWNNSA